MQDQKIRYVGLQVCVQPFTQSACQEYQVYQEFQVCQVYQISLSRGGSLFQEFQVCQVFQVRQVGDFLLCARIPSKLLHIISEGNHV